MDSILHFHLICFVVLTLYSHSRITCDARMLNEDPRRSGAKTNSSEADATSGGNAVVTARMGPDGKTTGNCQCVAFQFCNHQDVYRPTAGESDVQCGVNKVCCIQSQNFKSASSNPAYKQPVLIPRVSKRSTSSQMTDATLQSSRISGKVCVARSRCDPKTVEQMFAGPVPRKNGIPGISSSNCSVNEIPCPADKVLPETYGNSSSGPSVKPVPDDNCICVPRSLCGTVWGGSILVSRKECGTGAEEICCPRNLVKPIDPNPVKLIDPIPPSDTECGMRKRSPLDMRIIGGSAVEFGEFPWMVLLIEKKNNIEEVLCGASLVSHSIVLTAGHCVYQKNESSLIVRAGEFDLSSSAEEMPHQDKSIEKMTIHEQFWSPTFFFDLALLIVDTPFTYGSNVAPVCLPLVRSHYSPVNVSIYDFDNCIATGWGIKSNNDMTKPVTLSKIDLKLVPEDQCLEQLRKSKLGPEFMLHQSLICAIGAPGTDTCKGDGGGPLICPLRENSKKFVQVGVIAAGVDCSSTYPSLYASLLQANSDWITQEIINMNVFDKLLKRRRRY